LSLGIVENLQRTLSGALYELDDASFFEYTLQCRTD